MRDFWIRFGGWSVWLFIVSMPPQFITNFQQGMYTSGPLATWVLIAVAYFAFGTYVFLRKDYIVAVGQFTGGIFSLIITAQYFIYPHIG